MWNVERFADFCSARQALLASQLNEMLGLPQWSPVVQPADEFDDPEPDVEEMDHVGGEGQHEIEEGVWQDS
jgi:hypothetical protein